MADARLFEGRGHGPDLALRPGNFGGDLSSPGACRTSSPGALMPSSLVMRMRMVTHEMKFAREVASHVIYLHNGLIEEQGPPDQLFGAPKSERLKQFLKSVA
jgi:hypothetical protein